MESLNITNDQSQLHNKCHNSICIKNNNIIITTVGCALLKFGVHNCEIYLFIFSVGRSNVGGSNETSQRRSRQKYSGRVGSIRTRRLFLVGHRE